MEDKEGENDKKSLSQSQSQSQARSRSRSKVQSQNEAPKEEEEENAAVPRTDPSAKTTPSHNSYMVTSPSVMKAKSTSDKSKLNIPSPGKVSIKTTGENEQNREEVSEPVPKGSLLAGSQSVVAQPSTGGGGGPGAGGITVSGSKGTVLTGGGSRGTVLPDGGSRGTVFADGGSKGTVIAAGGGSRATVIPSSGGGGGGGGGGGFFQGDNFLGVPCVTGLLQKRNPFIHDPPYPEERRARVQPPRSPIDYIINLREDLADFQESHGLPRTRDYSFVSLGLALAQETGRAILSVFQMFTELFPILAIVSLILRFALDKMIEILETTDTMTKLKKSIIFALEMLAIMIPLWILFGTIIIPLITLILSLFKRVLRIKGGKKKVVKARPKVKTSSCSLR